MYEFFQAPGKNAMDAEPSLAATELYLTNHHIPKVVLERLFEACKPLFQADYEAILCAAANCLHYRKEEDDIRNIQESFNFDLPQAIPAVERHNQANCYHRYRSEKRELFTHVIGNIPAEQDIERGPRA